MEKSNDPVRAKEPHPTSCGVEILAPAGGRDALLAAVRCGADVVYLGLSDFNARQGAANFLLEHPSGSDRHTEKTTIHVPPLGEMPMTLSEAVRYCHLCGVRVYLTLNTLLFDAEFSRLQEMVQLACVAPVDGIIVQDLGVWLALKQWCPTMPIHASTQMTVHTALGVSALQKLGFSRVVLARELSLTEVAEIQRDIAHLSMETELFVHGALCVSVSGQCYMSALIGGRSANKGSCAGSCRLPFSSCGSTRRRTQGNGDATEEYALSLKDNCLVTHGEELALLGVTSLKIEGRMKRAEYVAAAVTAYRKMRAGETVDRSQLQAVFSRDGFTDGYFTGDAHQDGGTMFGMRSGADVPSDKKAIDQALRGLYHKEIARYPVTMLFRLLEGQPATLTLSTTTARGNYSVTVTGAEGVLAHTAPLSLALAEQTLRKLGGTVFYLDTFVGEIAPACTLKKSQLTALRRQAVEEICAQMIGSFLPLSCSVTPLRLTSGADSGGTPTDSSPLRGCRVRFATIDQMDLSSDLLEQVSLFSLPLWEVVNHRKRLFSVREKLWIELDRVMFGEEKRVEHALARLAAEGFRQIEVSNLAHIELGHRLQLQMLGTAFLNVTNAYSAEAYRQMGLCGLELSFEGRAEQLNEIARAHDGYPMGMIAYGHLPMMVLRSCPLWQAGADSCGSCAGGGHLIDRKGEQMLLLCHDRRYREILNPRVLWVADLPPLWEKMQFLTVYFTVETAKQCGEILSAHLVGASPKKGMPFTRGLYRRGIS